MPVSYLQQPYLLRASKTFTGAANLGATGVNELFTTTGAVRIEAFHVRCTSDMVDAVDGALFRIGVSGDDDCFSGVTFEGVFDLDTLDAGDALDHDNGVTDGVGSNMTQPNVASGVGAIIVDNIIMTISTQAITGGVLEFYVLYRPLSADGNLAIGAGMVAI